MNRKLLKENAKIALKRNFWMIMLVVLVAQFLGVSDVGAGGSTGSSGGSLTEEEQAQLEEWIDDLLENSGGDTVYQENGLQQMSTAGTSGGVATTSGLTSKIEALTAGTLAIGLVLVILFAVLIFAYAFAVFVTNPIRVGYRRFFMRNRSNQGKFGDLFSVFAPKYLNVVKGMLVTDLIIFGWTLLFIIPGIIKAYQYFFVPFILSENPDMSGARAREISKKMTDGYKFQIFVLGLSFIGWHLLTALLVIPAALLTCCFMGIGAQLVYVPLGGYVSATYAELYAERREFALYTNIASGEELCGFQIQVES